MNIEELREQWHRDADHGTDWHEQAWHLMAELDEARSELASRPKSLADYWAGRAKKAEKGLGQARADFLLAREQRNDLTFILEAAEQKRDNYGVLWRAAEDEQNQAIARAEDAEALLGVAQWQVVDLNAGYMQALDRAEAAETRITAALAWFADTDCTWTYRVEMARRALTEGTGQ